MPTPVGVACSLLDLYQDTGIASRWKYCLYLLPIGTEALQ
jgi:hypothetical protein